MDTIQGSSGAAAALNQILGDQVFSGNQLLRMKEGERAEKIRAAFMENDALMSDIKEGGIAGKFALQSVAEAMPGMSEDQVRRFILTGKKDSVKAAVAGRVGDQATKAEQEKFKNSIDNYRAALDKGTKEVLNTLSEIRQVQIRARASARREEIESGRPGFISGLGVTSMMGPMPGMVTRTLAARAFDAGGSEDLKRVIALAQMGIITDKELDGIMRGLTDTSEGGAKQIRARLKIRELTRGKTGESLSKTLEARLNSLPRPVRGAIDSIRELSPFTARQIIKELGPKGLLSVEGRDTEAGKKLFDELNELGEKMQEDETADIRTLAKAATDGDDDSFSILKNLDKIAGYRVQMRDKTKTGSASVTATRNYVESLSKRGGSLAADRFRVRRIESRGEFLNKQRETEPKIPERRGLTPEGAPEELTSNFILKGTAGEKLGVVVDIKNSGPPIDRRDLMITARVRRLEERAERVDRVLG